MKNIADILDEDAVYYLDYQCKTIDKSRLYQPCRVCCPLRSGECGDSLPPRGVAGEQLYQLQAASGDGLCQCFGKVSTADDHYAFQRSLHIVLQ